MKNAIIIFIISIVLLSCTDNNLIGESKFSIHFPKNEDADIEQLRELELTDIELNPTPWLSSDDIISYDFSSHNIYLKGIYKEFFPDSLSNGLPQNWMRKPFVVTAFNKPRYLGYIYSSTITKSPEGVYISDLNFEDFPEDIIHISYSINYYTDLLNYPDSRYNDLIKAALIYDNVFQSGIELIIENIEIVENSDSSKVQCTFTLTNKDDDNLHVLDTDLFEKNLFPYISQGIALWSETTGSFASIKPTDYSTTTPFENWKPEWFSKIESNESMTRTIVVDNYPKIPDGVYYCFLNLNFSFDIDKDERYLTDGRYWIGEITAEPIQYNINTH